MIRLADNGALRTTVLTQMLGLESTQAISGYLKPLREKEFVVSEKGLGGDKRFVYHELTQKGREFLDGLRDSRTNTAPEMKLWTNHEIEREFGKNEEKTGSEITYCEQQERENDESTRQEELKRMADELRRKNAADEEKKEFGIQENEDGSLSF